MVCWFPRQTHSPEATIHVLLSGQPKLDSYGRDHPLDSAGTMRLSPAEGNIMRRVIVRSSK